MDRRVLLTVILVLGGSSGCQPVDPPSEGKAAPASPTPAPTPAPAEPSTRPLALPGITIDVPLEFVDLDPAQQQRMISAAERAAPPGSEAHTELVGRRAPEGIRGGMVYVQRQVLASSFIPKDLVVRDALQAEIDEVPAQIASEGLQVTHVERDERDGGLELCADARAQRDGKTLMMSLCTLGVVDPEQRFVFLTTGCLGDRSVCSPIIDSRRVEPPSSLALDGELTPTPAPGIPSMREDGLGWLRFGMSREELRTACREGGHRVDDYDWAVEGAVPKQWFEDGLIARCSGLDVSIGPGRVLKVDASFSPDGTLGIANLRVDASLDVMRGALTIAYPDTWAEQDHLLHFIDRDAQGHQVISIGTSPTKLPELGTPVTVMSKAGSQMPLPELPVPMSMPQ